MIIPLRPLRASMSPTYLPPPVAPMCFRISAVPQKWSERDLLEALQTVDPSLGNQSGLSLFPACCGSTQTALLNLYDDHSHNFNNIDASKPKYVQVPKTTTREEALLVIDSRFYDLTPLNSPGGDILAELVPPPLRFHTNWDLTKTTSQCSCSDGPCGPCLWILAQQRNPSDVAERLLAASRHQRQNHDLRLR